MHIHPRAAVLWGLIRRASYMQHVLIVVAPDHKHLTWVGIVVQILRRWDLVEDEHQRDQESLCAAFFQCLMSTRMSLVCGVYIHSEERMSYQIRERTSLMMQISPTIKSGFNPPAAFVTNFW